MKGRQILNAILVADEAKKKMKKKGCYYLRLILKKAYDSVDWKYLYDVMGKMSFPNFWRKWVKDCVSTTTLPVLVNGSPTKEFPLAQGLRQGDPYLFWRLRGFM